MLFALLSVLVLAAAGRAAWSLHRIWKALPRRNADFGQL